MERESNGRFATAKRNAKRVGIVIVLSATFLAGGWAVPKMQIGYHKVFDIKPFEAPGPKLSDFNQAVQTAMADPKNQETYRHSITAIVSLDWANKYMGITKKEQLQSEYAIPDSLVTAINATETARKVNQK